MQPIINANLAHKRDVVLRTLGRLNRVVVALSGGVDSAVLAGLAVRALGADRVIAATGSSSAVAGNELESAREVALALGLRHVELATQEMQKPEYRANSGDRCFHCRSELFARLTALARKVCAEAVVYGAIVDDLGEIRPGMRAARDAGVLAPLLEAGLGKVEVRILAAELGLSVSGKPAEACLASRLPVGTLVTPERLAGVEKAEAGLRALGLGVLRVRHHGDVARIETDEAGRRILEDQELRGRAVEAVRAAGFRFVALDLEGYRSGSVATPGTPEDLSSADETESPRRPAAKEDPTS